MTESELRAIVVKMAHELGWRVFSLPIAKTRRPVKDATGYPDLTLARDRRVLWIELKQQDASLRTEQFGWMRALPQDRMIVVRPSDLDNLTVILA
jgi:hypothetical protein